VSRSQLEIVHYGDLTWPEVAELRRANQILRDASVYFAQELDPTRRR